MKSIPIYQFINRKYNTDLLVDVFDINFMKECLNKTPIYRESYYCIILITDGEEEISIDGKTSIVQRGCVICSRPGEVWHWQYNSRLEGYVLMFQEEFLLSFFNDSAFFNQLAYLHPDRVSPYLTLTGAFFERINNLLETMKREIDGQFASEKNQHLLRAMLYETLMLLDRAECRPDAPFSNAKQTEIGICVNDFVRLVSENFSSQHDVEFYADKLCITSNYLNKIVRQSLDTTSKLYIQSRILQEAKRLLNYTALTVNEISDKLHFCSSSYFIQFFRKHLGITPKQYRKR